MKPTKFNTKKGNKSISRRTFIERSAISFAGLSTVGSLSFTRNKETETTLRVIAYNVYGCTGWPKDNMMAKKAVEKGQMAIRFANELALYSPDIINFSESPDESLVKEIAGHLGMKYIRFKSYGHWPGTLLTHLDIIDFENVPVVEGKRSEKLFTRHWGKATIRLKNNEKIIVHSAHLFPTAPPEGRVIRLQEISEICKAVKTDLRNVDSVLVIGDLNHEPDTPEYQEWIKAGFTDTFAETNTGEGPTIKSDNPTRRIDYILAQGPIAKQAVSSRPLFEGAFRLNPSDPASFALSDHLPQFTLFKTR